MKNKLIDHNHDNCIATPEFNTLVAGVFDGRLTQANLLTKTDFDTNLNSVNQKTGLDLTGPDLSFLTRIHPQDIEMLGWCPAGTASPHGEKVPL